MIIAVALASIGFFLGAMWLFNVAGVATDALATARGAIATMRDQHIDDAVREQAVQRASGRLICVFASILVRGALAFGASVLPIWLAHQAGVVRSEEIITFLSRWDVMLMATVVIVIGYLIWNRLWRSI